MISGEVEVEIVLVLALVAAAWTNVVGLVLVLRVGGRVMRELLTSNAEAMASVIAAASGVVPAVVNAYALPESGESDAEQVSVQQSQILSGGPADFPDLPDWTDHLIPDGDRDLGLLAVEGVPLEVQLGIEPGAFGGGS